MEAVCLSRGADEAAGQAALTFVNEASGVGQGAGRADSISRGSLAGPRASVRRSRHVFLTSMAARIRGLYDAMPESQAMPVVIVALEDVPSLLNRSSLRRVINFALTARGGGMFETAAVSVGRDAAEGGGGCLGRRWRLLFNVPHNQALRTGIRKEQNCVLAILQ